ncbi:hypothetical protein ACE939_00010 [Aquimarina sp. W85]|uniref:hypothetical protein n=1 Tax=Aquimarina rhodophyticola TaxID=3342246 RepID=UPI00366B6525
MKGILLAICLIAYTSGYTQLQAQKDKSQDTLLLQMANDRVALLQQELNLTNTTANILRKKIVEYSIEADKIIQSELSYNDKARKLRSLLYYQEIELKNLLTVPQYYKYVNLTASN